MTLYVSQLQYQRIQDALESAYPQEGCGVLVGKRVFEVPQTTPQATEQATEQATAETPALPQDSYRQVVQAIPVANAWEPDLWDGKEDGGRPDGADGLASGEVSDSPSSHGAHDRYWIDPADLLRIQTQARHQGLEIIGIFHAHPDHPARPSECDRRLAWPVYSYLIASVCQGQMVDVQSWRLNDQQRFESERIHITPT